MRVLHMSHGTHTHMPHREELWGNVFLSAVFLIQVKFIDHKSNCLRLYISMAFSTFTVFVQPPPVSNSETFHISSQLNLIPIK